MFADTFDEDAEAAHTPLAARASLASEGSGGGSPRKALRSGTVVPIDSSATAKLTRGSSKEEEALTEKARLLRDLEEEGAKPQSLVQILNHARPELFYLFLGVVCVG